MEFLNTNQARLRVPSDYRADVAAQLPADCTQQLGQWRLRRTLKYDFQWDIDAEAGEAGAPVVTLALRVPTAGSGSARGGAVLQDAWGLGGARSG